MRGEKGWYNSRRAAIYALYLGRFAPGCAGTTGHGCYTSILAAIPVLSGDDWTGWSWVHVEDANGTSVKAAIYRIKPYIP